MKVDLEDDDQENFVKDDNDDVIVESDVQLTVVYKFK